MSEFSPVIVPWLSVSNANHALLFYRQAFAAVERERLEDDSGNLMLAQLAVDGAAFWIQQEEDSSAVARDRTSLVRMLLVVSDPDLFFDRAVGAGATPVASMHEEHGWRTGRVTDPFGHGWEFCRQLH